MTLFCICLVMMLITMIALKHETEALRKIMGIKHHWTMTSVVVMVVLSILFPLGLMYVWALIRRTQAEREYIRSARYEWM